jgi:hypothetical protein
VILKPDVNRELDISSTLQPGKMVRVTSAEIDDWIAFAISIGDIAGLSLYSPAFRLISRPVY